MSDDFTLRANIIDGVVRTMMVARAGEYNKDSNPEFDKFDLRAAISMALGLYADPDYEMIEIMNKITTR